MRRVVSSLVGIGLLAAATLWVLTLPRRLPESELAGLGADPVRGEYVFRAAGCASCHSAEGASGAELLKLGGGRGFASPFGTFYAPNISPDPVNGIGAWSVADFASALLEGTGRRGEHLYPAMPYPAYARMTRTDVVSLWAYMKTLPPVAQPDRAHDLRFPFSIRAGLGLWKYLYFSRDWVETDIPSEAETGRYIAEALAHCGECHTPRDALGGLQRQFWLVGAPNPAGKGMVPNITPARLDWNDEELLAFFQTGFKPDFDSAGGSMAEVQAELATLPEADLRSLMAYLRDVAPMR